jgi:hypothetical protein
MALFSYHGGIPAPLPEGLIGAETDRLKALGYSGPFSAPSFNPRTQVAKWLGEEWAVIDLSPEEIQQAEYLRLLGRADWTSFTEGLMGTSAYAKARAAAATSLQANVDCTELIAFLADARAGKPHIAGINNCFASIDQETSLTEEDKAQLYALVQNTGLGAFLVVPGYMPPELAMEGEDE